MNQPVYITTEQKKHPAFILAVDADYFDNQLVWRDGSATSAFGRPINMFPHELFLQTVQSDLVIREREYLDNGVTTHESRRGEDGKFKKGNPRYKQVLPYLIARQKQADGTMLFFPYRRTSGVGESRLAGNGSVGYGGHVDLVDIIFQNSIIDLLKTILQSLGREADEEFTVYDADGNKVAIDMSWFSFADLFILDDSNPVGELHLGLVMYLDIPTGYVLKATEDELTHVEPATAEALLADESFKPENWTRIYLDHFVQMAAFSAKYSIDHGGEKVGEIEPHFIAADLQALETGGADRNGGDGFAEPMADSMPYSHYGPLDLAGLPLTEIPQIEASEFAGMDAEQLIAFTDEQILAMSHEQIAAYRAAMIGQINGAHFKLKDATEEEKSKLLGRLDNMPTAKSE